MLTRPQWQAISAGAQLDPRTLAALVLGGPLAASTVKIVRLVAARERIVLPRGFFAGAEAAKGRRRT